MGNQIFVRMGDGERVRMPAEEVKDHIQAGTAEASEWGGVAELTKLAEAIKSYYSENEIWFDAAAFARDVALRFAIYRGD